MDSRMEIDSESTPASRSSGSSNGNANFCPYNEESAASQAGQHEQEASTLQNVSTEQDDSAQQNLSAHQDALDLDANAHVDTADVDDIAAADAADLDSMLDQLAASKLQNEAAQVSVDLDASAQHDFSRQKDSLDLDAGIKANTADVVDESAAIDAADVGTMLVNEEVDLSQEDLQSESEGRRAQQSLSAQQDSIDLDAIAHADTADVEAWAAMDVVDTGAMLADDGVVLGPVSNDEFAVSQADQQLSGEGLQDQPDATILLDDLGQDDTSAQQDNFAQQNFSALNDSVDLGAGAQADSADVEASVAMDVAEEAVREEADLSQISIDESKASKADPQSECEGQEGQQVASMLQNELALQADSEQQNLSAQQGSVDLDASAQAGAADVETSVAVNAGATLVDEDVVLSPVSKGESATSRDEGQLDQPEATTLQEESGQDDTSVQRDDFANKDFSALQDSVGLDADAPAADVEATAEMNTADADTMLANEEVNLGQISNDESTAPQADQQLGTEGQQDQQDTSTRQNEEACLQQDDVAQQNYSASDNRCGECCEELERDQPRTIYKQIGYHPKCFTCFECKSETLSGLNGFFVSGGRRYCSDCYNTNVAERCTSCGQAILEGGVRHRSRPFHHKCFKCAGCDAVLGRTPFVFRDSRTLCLPCYADKFAEKCSKCEKSIQPGEQYLQVESQRFHSECLTCDICDDQLQDSPFVQDDSRNVCVNCSTNGFVSYKEKGVAAASDATPAGAATAENPPTRNSDGMDIKDWINTKEESNRNSATDDAVGCCCNGFDGAVITDAAKESNAGANDSQSRRSSRMSDSESASATRRNGDKNDNAI